MKRKYNSPLIFNAFKPARITSFDVVRHFKNNLPKGYGKIGHFGTLDPFASGVLMIGVNGAAKLNDFIHDFLPKTYLAIGKLGVETPTGDMTVAPSQLDTTDYLKQVIANYNIEFLEEFLREHFLGEYWQAPHQYSAAKFEGKALHQWAREGIEIKKEKKRRFISKIEVVKFSFPYLILRCEVSSGTYIRTLFSDMANKLGTLGTLVSLVREGVGPCTIENTIKKKNWPNGQEWDLDHNSLAVDEVLPFGEINFLGKEEKLYCNGVKLEVGRAQKIIPSPLSDQYYWVKNEKNDLLGLAHIENGQIQTQFNFSANSSYPA